MAFQTAIDPKAPPLARRNLKSAMRRGFAGRCPACGVGRMFRSYLKVAPVCPFCGEELHHQRADDAPPYFTILVVGHLLGAAMLTVEELNDAVPIWAQMAIWPLLAVALSLLLLPRFKGALIALQWANKMHGFGTAPSAARRVPR